MNEEQKESIIREQKKQLNKMMHERDQYIDAILDEINDSEVHCRNHNAPNENCFECIVTATSAVFLGHFGNLMAIVNKLSEDFYLSDLPKKSEVKK